MWLVVDLKNLVLRRKSVFDQSLRYITSSKLHNLLKIDIPNIIHDPFDFDMIDEDARSHIEVVHYFVSHQIYILSRLAYHQLLA